MQDQTVRILYFAHSSTEDNYKHVSTGWNDTDISLTGISQSLQLRKATELYHCAAVYCSDLRRAVHTARLAFDERAPIIADARLRECNYGEYNGSSSRKVELLQIRSIRDPFPGGESYLDVQRRITYFLRELLLNHPGEEVGIVSHKGPQLALEVILNKRTWEQAFELDWRRQGRWQPGWRYTLDYQSVLHAP